MKTWLTVFILSVLVLSGCDKYEKAFTEKQVIDMAYQFVQQECLFPKEPNPLVQKPFNQSQKNSTVGAWRATYVENLAFIPAGAYYATHLEEWSMLPPGTEGKEWIVTAVFEFPRNPYNLHNRLNLDNDFGTNHKSFDIRIYDDLGEKRHGKVEWTNLGFYHLEFNRESTFRELFCSKVERAQPASPILKVARTNLDPTGLLLRDLANLVRDYRDITGKYASEIEDIETYMRSQQIEDLRNFIFNFLKSEIISLRSYIQDSAHSKYQFELMSSLTHLEKGISNQLRETPESYTYDRTIPNWDGDWNTDTYLDEFYAEFNEIIKIYNSQK